MKKVAGMLRLELAQYRELAAFAQFATDLDKATKRQLDKGARLVELLKQLQYQPMPVEQQVLMIFAGTAEEGFLMDIPVGQIQRFEAEFLEHMKAQHPELLAEIRDKKDISAELRASLVQAISAFKGFFQSE